MKHIKTKDNIHKVVNLNNFIKELRIYYEVITYSEYSYDTHIEWYKVHTILYCDSSISLLIVNNKYRVYQEWNGSTFDCSTIRELKKILQYSILNIEQKYKER